MGRRARPRYPQPMARTAKRFIFRPLWIVLGAVATVLTIILGVLQIGGWVNENAVWILWVSIAALILSAMLLIARIAALTSELERVSEELHVARADADRLGSEAAAAARLSAIEVPDQRPASLGDVDKRLAVQLYGYSSDLEVLNMLGDFFPYQIPRRPVRRMEELADLPLTRSAYNELLQHQLTTLADAATEWLTKLRSIVSGDGDFYTTKLQHHVSEAAYQQNAKLTDELGSVGFKLHEKLLEYQRYFASLDA